MRYILLVLLLAGCTTTTLHVDELEAASELAADCASLGPVSGASNRGKGAIARRDNAKQAALLQAQELGASHVVWANFRRDHRGALAEGIAYRCPE